MEEDSKEGGILEKFRFRGGSNGGSEFGRK